jgi:hypothetical protein
MIQLAGVTRGRGDFVHALATSKQPDHVQVASFDGIKHFTIPLLQLIKAEASSNLDISWNGFPLKEELS